MNTTIGRPGEDGSEFTALRFFIQQILSRVNTSSLVLVTKVDEGGTGPVGSVDVIPMINQLDGAGNGHPLSTLHNLPYLRIQGGANAIILDPQIGDIGIAVFCSRDISTVKRTKAQANPGSWAMHSMSDGLYLGGVLNGAPTQYVYFGENEITIHTPGEINFESSAVKHNGVNIGEDHVHDGIEPGTGTTSVPH